MAYDTSYTHYSSDEVSAAHAPPYYAPADHVHQEAPVDPQAWLLEHLGPPDWTDDAGQPSQHAPLLTADGFVPQVLPCVAGGPVEECPPGTEHICSDYGGQPEWPHCAPPIGNNDQVYGDRILQTSAAVSSARSEYLSVRKDIPYTGAAHHTGSTSSPVGYRVDEYAFGRQPEGDYHPMDHCDPCQPLNGAPLSGSGSGSEYQQFVREEFPPSGHTDGTFDEDSTEYFGDQDTRGFTSVGNGTSYDSGGRNYTDGGQNMCTDITLTDATGPPSKMNNYITPGGGVDHHGHPTAANVASLEMVGSLTMQPDPRDGDAEHAETAQHSHQCRLDSGCGKTCGADVSINRKRHFKSHLRRELRRIKNGSMDLSGAKIIKSEADLRRAEELEVPCPYGCTIYGVRTTYARKANLRRHLEQTCWKPLSDKEIDDVATKAFSRKGKTSRRT
ncbi:hypothetical protein JB92DRAFT_3074624 [Gautieria morchelliformis]|nr:hypothetical protein JB92DRAFT_3074624 [Gautieria morchelliformis]